jgi:hypothetical protein
VINIQQKNKKAIPGLRRMVSTLEENPAKTKMRSSFELEKTFFLLELTGNEKVSEMVKKCRSVGIIERPDVSQGSEFVFPEADRRYVFYQKIKENILAVFEILEKDDLVLQSGIQIIYPPDRWLDEISYYYQKLLRILEANYGLPVWVNVNKKGVLSFENKETFSYLSEFKMGDKDVLTVRVASRAFWSDRESYLSSGIRGE